MLTHLDLFSGIGGFTLACEWVGIETICFVEKDAYCQKVLKKHYPNVPIVEDIRDVEAIKEVIANAQLYGLSATTQRRSIGTAENNSEEGAKECSESSGGSESKSKGYICTERTRSIIGSSVTLITAGFPCQPFSVAGKRGGKEDDRYLWPETLDVIKAIKPRWILLENVVGIINLALDTVLSDLEGAGYSYETLIIPACAVNAPHRRDRVWIVANTNGQRRDEVGVQVRGDKESQGASPESLVVVGEGEVRRGQGDWWAVEPKLGRVAHGISHRVERLKCLGNAIVPKVAYQILKVIAELELA